MVRYLIIIFILISIVTRVNSQSVIINDNCRNAYQDILSLKLNDAEKLIESEKIVNPDNLFIVYLENYIDFLKVTIGEDETLFRNLENNIPDRIKTLKNLPDTSRYKNYLIGNINLQWATAHLKFGNYATGALEINRSYRLLEQNQNEFPDFIPNSITLGILHIMIGIVPDSYNWLLNLISMEGSVQQGQDELITSYNICNNDTRYNFLKDEILFYMGMVNLNLSPDPKFAKFLLQKIELGNKNSLLLKYLAINTMMKNGMNSKALDLFSTIDTSANYYPFYYLKYLHGDCFIRVLDTENAREKYHSFLNYFKGYNYIKSAWQKIAWSYIIEGDTNAYNQAMKNVLKFGEKEIDADKKAQDDAYSEIIPNVELLKSRLLFDGGYYKESRAILVRFNTNKISIKEKVEINYRMGRIAHRLNNIDEAKKHYDITIETGSNFPEYLAANSALKMGNIYEIEHDNNRSAYYYNLCLELDFDEYRNSIRAKAKQGLLRVSEK